VKNNALDHNGKCGSFTLRAFWLRLKQEGGKAGKVKWSQVDQVEKLTGAEEWRNKLKLIISAQNHDLKAFFYPHKVGNHLLPRTARSSVFLVLLLFFK